MEQSRLDVIINERGFCHVTRCSLVPVTRFEMATSAPRSTGEMKAFLEVRGADKVQCHPDGIVRN